MKINDVIYSVGRSGFFNRDLAAIKAGARADGFAYPDKPVSPGFEKIVQPGTAISVMLLLSRAQLRDLLEIESANMLEQGGNNTNCLQRLLATDISTAAKGALSLRLETAPAVQA